MSRRSVVARLSLGATLAGVLLLQALGAAQPAAAAVTTDAASQGRAYPGDPDAEAALVAAEDSRLNQVRSVDSVASSTDPSLANPYRLATGASYTLVLTARTAPYTVADLLVLAPQTFVRRPDGAYLLSESLVVEVGATLNLSDTGGLRLLLASDTDGFVSIVNYGGRLNIAGTEGAPASIASFDRGTEKPDVLTDDGRAYLRSIGGQVSITYTKIEDLGFWSGRTGGLSLTGTDRPDSGSLSLKVGTVATAGGKDTATPKGGLPAGDLPVVQSDSPEYSYVSAAIQHTDISGNAFGLFVSGANGVDVRDSSFSRSLVSGLVLHRYVVNSVVEKTSANNNGHDGIVLARATTGIVLSQVQANGNARNGVTLSGLPLATGPSAMGTSVGSYGNNSISNSEASDNRRYGVEVAGGTNISVLANDVDRNEMGVVVHDSARDVTVVGNDIRSSTRQGIAVRDGVASTTVSGNMVKGSPTSVYVRDSVADIERNTLSGASRHAVSLVGEVGATMLKQNTISGRGASAIDTQRAGDLDRDGWVNDTDGWSDTTPFLVTLKRFAQPLTLLWGGLGLLLLFTAVRGARARKAKRHPYADQAPLWDSRAIATQSPPQREEVSV